MLPLARYRDSGDPVLLGPGAALTAGDFLGQVHALATALPNHSHVINLCESRHAFMVGFGAALKRGQISLLPSAQGSNNWEQLLAQFPDSYLLSEKPLAAARTFNLTLFLASGANTAGAMPEIEAAQTAAILFTSGSTGEPRAHNRTWGQLCNGAAALMDALGWGPAPGCAVLGSVPPQHMFGLESTVILPWYAGIAAHAQRPLLPADLQAALRHPHGPSWWMTTPAHLRAAIRTPIDLPGLQGIVASTMSLSVALANTAEARWQVPVMEIYGSTETGALAIRRPAEDDAWRPVRGVALRREGDAICAIGGHFDGPMPLADQLEIKPDGRFYWLGRVTDLVKVAGKRTSLALLNQSLLAIDGVDDGAYFPPGNDAGEMAGSDDPGQVQRLCAFYVSAALSPQQVVNALRTQVDPVFLPRPLFRVERLPRNESGKLTQESLWRLLGQCRSANAARESPLPGSSANHDTDMAITPDHPALAGHFPGNPVVPGVVILARVAEAIQARFPERTLGTLFNARFYAPLRPGETFSVEQELEQDRVLFKVRCEARVLASGQWACRAASS